jgi:hypothetical protein
MTVALTYVLVSIIVLFILTFVYVIEDIKGKRVFFLSARDKFDTLLTRVVSTIEKLMASLTSGFVRLLLHYGAHSILKRLLLTLRTLEGKVEQLALQNKKIAKRINSFRTKNVSQVTQNQTVIKSVDVHETEIVADVLTNDNLPGR